MLELLLPLLPPNASYHAFESNAALLPEMRAVLAGLGFSPEAGDAREFTSTDWDVTVKLHLADYRHGAVPPPDAVGGCWLFSAEGGVRGGGMVWDGMGGGARNQGVFVRRKRAVERAAESASSTKESFCTAEAGCRASGGSRLAQPGVSLYGGSGLLSERRKQARATRSVPLRRKRAAERAGSRNQECPSTAEAGCLARRLAQPRKCPSTAEAGC
jgi:hypothetical protein